MNTSPARSTTLLQILLLLAVLIAAGVALWLWSSRAVPLRPTRQVRLRVEASGGYATITWKVGADPVGKLPSATVPWEKTLTLTQGTQIIVTAANPTQTGHVTCWIRLDGAEWKTETTQSPKDAVACGGIVP